MTSVRVKVVASGRAVAMRLALGLLVLPWHAQAGAEDAPLPLPVMTAQEVLVPDAGPVTGVDAGPMPEPASDVVMAATADVELMPVAEPDDAMATPGVPDADTLSAPASAPYETPVLPPDPAAPPSVARGEQLFVLGDPARGVVACISCHGPAGQSLIEMNPMLAGQHAAYTLRQLLDFQIAPGAELPARASPIMGAMVMTLTTQDMADLARYLAQQPAPPPQVVPLAEPAQALGAQLWHTGLRERSIPACAACHGAVGQGIPGEYPALAGQFPSYLAQQLEAFRSGERVSNDTMLEIAQRLTTEEIEALAGYAAGLGVLPGPASASPPVAVTP